MTLSAPTPTSETTVTRRTVRQIARCKKCKTTKSRLVTKTTTTTTRWTAIGMRTHRTTATSIEGEQRVHTAISCACDKLVPYWDVDGHHNDTPCDARCTSATGHKCECSCGGKNHGADHG